MSLVKGSNYQRWYTGRSASPAAIAQRAYEEGFNYFRDVLLSNKQSPEWIKQAHTIDEVVQLAEKAETAYSTPGQSTIKKQAHQWAVAFSSRVKYYGKVMDVLSQHHPEYLSLVWGATKFVLQGILNHAEIIAEFTKAMAEIADALQRAALRLELYPNDIFEEIVARLYAYVMLFMQQAVKWYSQGSFRRALLSVINPWSLKYEETVAQIRSLRDALDANGNAAAGAELRDVSKSLTNHEARLDTMRLQNEEILLQSKEMRSQLNNITTAMSSIQRVTNDTFGLTQTVSLKMDDQLGRIHDIQYTQILSCLKPKRLPSDVLHSCQSIAKRRKINTQLGPRSQTVFKSLNEWCAQSGSTLFVLRTGARAEAVSKDLAVEMVTYLQSQSFKVIWFFSERLSEDDDCNINHVLKSLIYQILAHYTDVLKDHPHLINASKFHALSETEMRDLLAFLLTRLRNCFLIIETGTMYSRADDGRAWCQTLETLFMAIMDKVQTESSVLKVLLVSYGNSLNATHDPAQRRMTSFIQASSVPIAQARKLAMKNNARSLRQLKKLRA